MISGHPRTPAVGRLRFWGKVQKVCPQIVIPYTNIALTGLSGPLGLLFLNSCMATGIKSSASLTKKSAIGEAIWENNNCTLLLLALCPLIIITIMIITTIIIIIRRRIYL